MFAIAVVISRCAMHRTFLIFHTTSLRGKVQLVFPADQPQCFPSDLIHCLKHPRTRQRMVTRSYMVDRRRGVMPEVSTILQNGPLEADWHLGVGRAFRWLGKCYKAKINIVSHCHTLMREYLGNSLNCFTRSAKHAGCCPRHISLNQSTPMPVNLGGGVALRA